ncbi:hypothetical protein ENKNEFLB_04049 [Nocardioides aquaticus]|uniref:WD40 repeat domain-containing protein n=1 Tax=Nocardioides aquaticus TaxID=160826 RepID=A0ABX8END5_9ACTN|nr:hypothetical protein [Nocardioides aquaticus]QVT81637.1 hypothetical protein ENKNEFLB_04049 [Nocardioides aquaticus]
MLELRRYLGVAVAVPFLVGGALAITPEVERKVVLTFADPAIVESSGLVALDGGRVVTTNDSGDEGRVFTVDADGRTVGTTTWGEARDVEALAPLEDDVLVGDIGDNGGVRDSVSILRVPVGPGEQEVDAASAVELVYPDGPRDAETLMVDPVSGRVLVASKVVLGGALYEVPPDAVPPSVGAPAPVEPVRLRELGDVRGFATDGAFFPDGRHLVVRDYGSATVYSWPDLRDVGSFDLPEQEQGEGIAVDEVDGEFQVLVSSEGADSQVLRAPMPQALAEAVAPLPEGSPAAQPEDPAVVTPPGAYDAPVATDALDRGPGVGPWLVGGVFLVGVLVVLLRSLRPR